MATSVSAAFDELHGRLTPLKTEVDAASRHRASVEAALKAAFGLNRFFQSGSWGNGTSVRIWSDVDYFASLPHELQAHGSSKVLELVCDALDRRFATTPVRVDPPAVLVGFGASGSERYEVVPSFICDTSDPDAFVYEIASPGGGWMTASPEGQHRAVAREDQRLKSRLRPMIRFIKAWKYWNSVPISSFYLETWAVAYAKHTDLIVPKIDLGIYFDCVHAGRLGSIPSLIGDGVVASGADAADRSSVLESLLTARVIAELAWEAEKADDVALAFRYWDRLFDGRFPARG